KFIKYFRKIIGGRKLFQSTWNRLWGMHEQVKDMFRFFTKPNKSKIATVQQNGSYKTNQNGNGSNGQPPSYNQVQMIGLVFGPLLVVILLLFITAAVLSEEGVTIVASILWIVLWWIKEAVTLLVTLLLPLVLFPITRGQKVDLTASY